MSHRVASVMSAFPLQAGPDTPLIAASAMMVGHDIRHLPIVAGGRVLGVLSAAELRLATHLGSPPEAPVSGLLTRPALEVELDTPLREVVAQMAEEGVDAAVVLRRGRIAGILTLADVCAALVQHLPAPLFDDPGGVA